MLLDLPVKLKCKHLTIYDLITPMQGHRMLSNAAEPITRAPPATDTEDRLPSQKATHFQSESKANRD